MAKPEPSGRQCRPFRSFGFSCFDQLGVGRYADRIQDGMIDGPARRDQMAKSSGYAKTDGGLACAGAASNPILTHSPKRGRLGWCLAILGLLARGIVAQAPPLDVFLNRGGEFERQRLWQQAADVYERGCRMFPERAELREKWQRAERLYSLTRRYHDPSYLGELLRLDELEVYDLYREVVGKINTHYVEPVSFDRMVKQGYRSLLLALDDPEFLAQNAANMSAQSVDALRRALAAGPRAPVADAAGALAETAHVAEHAKSLGVRSATPVVLEFLTAASEGLDPYSTHLTPHRLHDLYAMIDGNFVGLGVEVKGSAVGLEIVQVLADSPAEAAGLLDGDIIVKVEDKPVTGLNVEEAANRLQGKEGTAVTLRIRRAPGVERDVQVRRREVIVHSVCQARLLEGPGGVGYIRLSSFQKQTVRELEIAVESLLGKGMRSLVLDLRGNPGGLLDVALQLANHFIDNGTLVSTQGRAWGQSWSHRAKPYAAWKFPLAVLIDGESASASEILAGAIRDHRRGLLVGTRTFGKGSVQSIFPLRTAATGLRLTTAYFYSPNGHVFQHKGVQPDVVVPRALGILGEELTLPRRAELAGDPQLRKAVAALTSQVASRR